MAILHAKAPNNYQKPTHADGTSHTFESTCKSFNDNSSAIHDSSAELNTDGPAFL